jgi:hypothetical protein
MSCREAWMGMLHVRPLPRHADALDGAVAGLGWVLALATDEADYLRQVTAEMDSLGLFIAEATDVDKFTEFTSCAETVQESFERLSDEWPVQYHTFHTTGIDDA